MSFHPNVLYYKFLTSESEISYNRKFVKSNVIYRYFYHVQCNVECIPRVLLSLVFSIKKKKINIYIINISVKKYIILK